MRPLRFFGIDLGGKRPHVSLLVLQPTPFCNLDCAYCYLPNRSDRRLMSHATLDRALQEIFASGFLTDHLSIVWHAGEPLVLKRQFYEDAFERVEKLRPGSITVGHSIQTNATLIDRGWTELFSRHRVQVGVSLDGPRHLHDFCRRTRGGSGTFDATMRGVRALQDAGVPFHVIAVLTSRSLCDPDGMYDFFVANGIRQIGFNFDEQEGVHKRSSMAFDGVAAAYKCFLRRFLDRIHAAPPGTLILREFDSALGEILSSPRKVATNPQVSAFKILCIDVAGNVSTFSPELLGMKSKEYADFIVGNIHKEPLPAIARGSRLRQLARDIEVGVSACERECGYFRFCGGGAPANKFFENGRFESTETLYCRLTKKAALDAVIEHLEARMEIAGNGGSESRA